MPTRLTNRDLEIINSISYWKSLTAEQLGQLHFSKSNNSCALARRRLQKLMQIKNINVYRKIVYSRFNSYKSLMPIIFKKLE